MMENKNGSKGGTSHERAYDDVIDRDTGQQV